jgi:hypothetical protein
MTLTLPTRIHLTGAIIGAAFMAAACGGSSGSATASPESSPTPSPTKAAQYSNVNACDLVSADSASAAVGTTVQSVSGSGSAQGAGICIYGSSDGQTTVFVFGQALADASTAQSTSPDQIVAAMHGAYGVSNAKAVDGIGDKAIEYTITGMSANPGLVIFVIKSNVVLLIAASPLTDSTKIEALARTAVGKLQ